jgi:flagellar basal body-associated protein FliL
MGRSLLVALLAVLGLLCAAGMGYAAYFVSRGSVAVPVTRLQQQPAQQLTPARVRPKAKARPKRTVTTTTTRTVPTTTVDEHGGRGGSGNSGHGGGGDD